MRYTKNNNRIDHEGTRLGWNDSDITYLNVVLTYIGVEFLALLLQHINIRPWITGAVQPKVDQLSKVMFLLRL